MKALIAEMTTESNFANIATFIPDTMNKSYANNTVSAAAVTYDFTNFVNVSNIIYGGFGKGWHRVINNVDTVNDIVSEMDKATPYITMSISLLNTYLDSEYADSLTHEEESESGFKVSVSYDETTKMLEYSISFAKDSSKSIPEVSISYNKDTKVKEVFVKVSDNKQMKYKTTKNSFEFGAQVSGVYYYMQIEKLESVVTGKLYLGVPLIGGYAEFYIDDNYVTVVADKGDGLIPGSSYNCEVYDKSTGKLLGFENKADDKVAERNKIWLNLNDISGITSIKIDSKGKIYLNGSSSEYVIDKVTEKLVITKNKYKIETYKQYFYEYDNETQKIIEHEVEVPMIFIQEEEFEGFSASFESKNSIAVSVTLDSAHLTKIMNEYDAKIEAVATSKEALTDEFVADFLK